MLDYRKYFFMIIVTCSASTYAGEDPVAAKFWWEEFYGSVEAKSASSMFSEAKSMLLRSYLVDFTENMTVPDAIAERARSDVMDVLVIGGEKNAGLTISSLTHMDLSLDWLDSYEDMTSDNHQKLVLYITSIWLYGSEAAGALPISVGGRVWDNTTDQSREALVDAGLWVGEEMSLVDEFSIKHNAQEIARHWHGLNTDSQIVIDWMGELEATSPEKARYLKLILPEEDVE